MRLRHQSNGGIKKEVHVHPADVLATHGSKSLCEHIPGGRTATDPAASTSGRRRRPQGMSSLTHMMREFARSTCSGSDSAIPKSWIQRFWHPRPDEAVNKRVLSTGETREFVSKNPGFGLNPRVDLGLCAISLPTGELARHARNLRNVGDTGEEDSWGGCQQNGCFELG
jgi:hypothetical protein